MKTEVLYSAEINRKVVSHGDDSCVEIITITMDIHNALRYSSYSELRDAIEAMNYEIECNIRIARPCSAYDCTGQAFTSSLKRLDRFVSEGIECDELVYVLKHHISIDC